VRDPRARRQACDRQASSEAGSLAPAAAGVAGALATVVAIGAPTDVVPNPWFARQTPVHAYDVLVLVASACWAAH
jgi:hypothetical protein